MHIPIIPLTAVIALGFALAHLAPGTRAAEDAQPSPATQFRVPLGRMETGHGVRVEVAADGLTAPWPRWGWDTAGARW